MFDRNALKTLAGDRNRTIGCICFVLASVFASVLVIKFGYILYGTYFGEDLSYFYKSKFETGMNYHNLPILAWLYHITANISPSISYQMLIYLLMLSMTSVAIWLLLSRFFVYPFVLICGILFAFTSHAIVGMIQYVAASHALVGLMFASLAILFSYWSMRIDKSLMERILLAVSGGAFIVFSSLSSAIFVLFPLVIPLHTYLVRKFSSGSMWVPMAFTFIPGLCSILYNLTYNLYDYDALPGWTDYTIGHAGDRAIAYVDYVLAPYMGIAPNFLILCYASAIAASLLWVASKVAPALPTKFSTASMRGYYYVAIPYLSLGSVLTLIPVLSLTSNPGPRYVYPAMVLAILAIFSIVDFLTSLWLRHFPQGKSGAKWILISLISVLLGWNFSVTYEFQKEAYGPMIRFQPKFESFIRENEKLWPQSAQIVIASDDMPATFAKGFHDWSTRYLRLITRREDVIGLFGWEKDMLAVEGPFVEFYDHGLDHGNFRAIVQRDGRPTYHAYGMVGLVKSRPTYAYRFDVSDGTAQRVRWLLVNASGGRWDLYRMTGGGIVLHESGTDTPAGLDRLGIARKDVFIYGKAN